MVELAFIISVLSGCLFATSEVLSFTNKVKSNGILQVLMSIFQKHQEQQQPPQMSQSPQSSPDFPGILLFIDNNTRFESVSLKINNSIESTTETPLDF